LLYPTQIQYSQNGRFAVAIHGGSSAACADQSPCPSERPHGAVSIIDNEKLTVALSGGGDFQRVPIDGEGLITRLGLEEGVGPQFENPRALVLQPIVSIIAPRVDDYVWRTSPVHIEWRSANVDRARFVVEVVDGNGTPSATGPAVDLFDAAEEGESFDSGARTAKLSLQRVLGSLQVADGDKLRITGVVLRGGEEISRTSTVVTFRFSQ
jgi:hypothetical protein